MNIFYVDKNPETAAKMMCDKHIIKMILESAQMLCTAKRVLDGKEYFDTTKNGRKIKRWRLENSNEEAIIYKAGWLNHPSTQWVMKSAYNYIWLYKHMMALNEEFGFDCKRIMIVNAPKTGKLKTKAVDVTKADLKAAKSALLLYQWLNKKERKVKNVNVRSRRQN